MLALGGRIFGWDDATAEDEDIGARAPQEQVRVDPPLDVDAREGIHGQRIGLAGGQRV